MDRTSGFNIVIENYSSKEYIMLYIYCYRFILKRCKFGSDLCESTTDFV